jgi:hypothetical protein
MLPAVASFHAVKRIYDLITGPNPKFLYKRNEGWDFLCSGHENMAAFSMNFSRLVHMIYSRCFTNEIKKVFVYEIHKVV